jgi:Skp family chaperone for outer membrane proteins
MTVKTLFALGALSSLALASTALAQAPATALPGGPAVAGVCTLRGQNAIADSLVGKSAEERLKQLSAVVEAELQSTGTQLQTEQQALRAMTKEQQAASQQRIQDFTARAQEFQRLQEIRSRELQLTRAQVVQTIESDMAPILAQVVTQRGCGIVLERSQLDWANPSMDVTDAVVGGLNAKITSLPPFDRVRVDPNTGNPVTAAASGAPAQPAAAATKPRKPH